MKREAYRLIELVRLLEERGHLFAADPRALTAALRGQAGRAEEKLLLRAQKADRDRKLDDALQRSAQTARLAAAGLTVMWAVLGFSGAAALLAGSGLNFFMVLCGVLGMNSLMFLLWLLWLPRTGAQPWFGTVLWPRGGDALSSALAALFAAEWRERAAKWRLGMLTHRFWLASLGGMLCATVLLLSLRQYTFNWESTLLSDGLFVRAVHYLGLLPSAVGFPVPDGEAVLGSRLNHNLNTAREWGGLLVGSIAVYGIVPRLAAWLFCRFRVAQCRLKLPLDLPYYQEIVRTWQREIVDADTQRETPAAAVAPFAPDPAAQKWAVLLERAWPDENWYGSVLAQDWQNAGLADSRDSVAALSARLDGQNVQLLIGVRAKTLPDRGLLRQIVRLAEAASGGAAVQLLAGKDEISDGLEHYLAQWRQALESVGMTVLEPAAWTQTGRKAV